MKHRYILPDGNDAGTGQRLGSSAATDAEKPARRSKWMGTLVAAATIALILDITGLGLCAVSYIWPTPASHNINKIGTMMLVFGIPFMFLMAHSLDKIDEEKL